MKPILCVITFALGTSTPIVTAASSTNASGNRRGDREEAPTSEDQSNVPHDIKITQSIRRALIANDSLSASAKNVKVITIDGMVTLRGSVKSAKERTLVMDTARKSAVGANFDERLEIEGKP